jgi:hypothetical protein
MTTPHPFDFVLSYVFVIRRITRCGDERNTKNLSTASWKYLSPLEALKAG